MKLVSACLAGYECRWNGKSATNEKIVKSIKKGELMPVCPEVLGGLKVPRSPAEIIDERVITKDGRDVTSEFILGAKKTLRIARLYGIDEFIGKEGSPSCGRSCIYDGSFESRLKIGEGVTARILRENGLYINDEEGFF